MHFKIAHILLTPKVVYGAKVVYSSSFFVELDSGKEYNTLFAPDIFCTDYLADKHTWKTRSLNVGLKVKSEVKDCFSNFKVIIIFHALELHVLFMLLLDSSLNFFSNITCFMIFDPANAE